MERPNLLTTIAALIALLSVPTLSLAGNVIVHTWIDGDGVRHFSDTPPAGTMDTAELVLYDHEPDVDAADDYYSIVNQWSRMRDERESRDEIALANKRLRLEHERQSEPDYPEDVNYPRTVIGGFGGFGGYGYGFPRYGHPLDEFRRDGLRRDRSRRNGHGFDGHRSSGDRRQSQQRPVRHSVGNSAGAGQAQARSGSVRAEISPWPRNRW